MTRAKGTDLSQWNGKVDFVKMRAAGISFVFCKASQRIADKTFAYNWNGAKAAGLLRGAYHYLDLGISEVTQANLFCSLLKDDQGELPPVLDIEEEPASYGMTFKTMQGRVWNFQNIVFKTLGQYPMPYMGYYSWREKMTPAVEWMRRPEYWLPWYADESIVRTPPPYTKWTFWQYTADGDGKTYGAPELAQIDLNLYCGTEAELRATYGQPPVVVTPVLTLEQRLAALETEARMKGWHV